MVDEFDRAPDVPLLTNPHRKAGFVVLQAPDIPSVLVEMVFMSNRVDEAKLKKPEYRRKVVIAMQRAIEDQVLAQAESPPQPGNHGSHARLT